MLLLLEGRKQDRSGGGGGGGGGVGGSEGDCFLVRELLPVCTRERLKERSERKRDQAKREREANNVYTHCMCAHVFSWICNNQPPSTVTRSKTSCNALQTNIFYFYIFI